MSEFSLTPDTMVEVMRKGLRIGIPPTALANLFDLDPEVVANLAMNVRRETYGTAELSEYLSYMTWVGLEKITQTIKSGSPEMSIKAAQAVGLKALATSVRQTPEEVKRAREELIAAIAQERLIEIGGDSGEAFEASAFVALDESSDDQGQGRPA